MNFSRKTKLKSSTTVLALIIIGLIVVVNIIGYQWFHRFDLTENKEFSVSNTSKTMLGSLDDIINIKVYFSEKLPPQYLGVAQEVKDILDEYKNLSGGKLKITYTDPKDDEETKAEAQRLGIPSVQFNIMENDQFQVTQGFLGLAVIYGDKKEVLPVIEDTKNLEYKLTASIKKVIAKDISTIGFVSSHEVVDPQQAMMQKPNPLKEFLKQQFIVVDVDTTLGNLVDSAVDVLIVNGPKDSFSDRELFVIDQFLMSGKSVMFLIDGAVVENGLQARANKTNLEKLLTNYGVTVENNFVLDVSNEFVSFNDGRSSFFTPYPFWVKAVRDGFDKDNVAVNKLESLLLPWVSSLTVDKNSIGENKVSELVKSSPKSWLQKEPFDLNPTQKFAPLSTDLKSQTLALFINGKFKSYFADKKIPTKDEAVAKDEVVASTETKTDSVESGRLVVVGDSDFIEENNITRAPNNLTFFQNTIDLLVQDEGLISIRAKGSADRPIKKVDDQERNSIKFLNIFGVTILILIIGVTRFYLRRKDNKREF
jgi:gliding-associated putative ABC transporter substrate-binding component GldG